MESLFWPALTPSPCPLPKGEGNFFISELKLRSSPGSIKLVLSTEFDYNNREARMSTQGSEAVRAPRTRLERTALGSAPAPKILAAASESWRRDRAVLSRCVHDT